MSEVGENTSAMIQIQVKKSSLSAKGKAKQRTPYIIPKSMDKIVRLPKSKPRSISVTLATTLTKSCHVTLPLLAAIQSIVGEWTDNSEELKTMNDANSVRLGNFTANLEVYVALRSSATSDKPTLIRVTDFQKVCESASAYYKTADEATSSVVSDSDEFDVVQVLDSSEEGATTAV